MPGAPSAYDYELEGRERACGGLLRDVLACAGPEDGQQEDLEGLDDSDVHNQHEKSGNSPEGGSGGVQRQAEDDGSNPAQQTDNRRQTDNHHEEPANTRDGR